MMRSSSFKLTVSVGISAYNEQASIARLLRQVLAQNTQGFTIDQIVVNSDGSSDATVQEVR